MRNLSLIRQTLLLAWVAIALFALGGTAQAQATTPSYNLTGTWSADDGGLYSMRQVNDIVWWVGRSTESLCFRRARVNLDFPWPTVILMKETR